MISQTVEYAFRAMGFLALHTDEAATCGMIAANTHVPPGYLSKVMRDLVKAQLVRSFRGPNGGFALAREARTISLMDIVNAVDPSRKPGSGAPELERDPQSGPLGRCLNEATSKVERLFADTTLGALFGAAQPPDLRPPPGPDPGLGPWRS